MKDLSEKSEQFLIRLIFSLSFVFSLCLRHNRIVTVLLLDKAALLLIPPSCLKAKKKKKMIRKSLSLIKVRIFLSSPLLSSSFHMLSFLKKETAIQLCLFSPKLPDLFFWCSYIPLMVLTPFLSFGIAPFKLSFLKKNASTEWVEAYLAPRKDEIRWMSWTKKPKGKSAEERLVVICKYRLFTVTPKHKVCPLLSPLESLLPPLSSLLSNLFLSNTHCLYVWPLTRSLVKAI